MPQGLVALEQGASLRGLLRGAGGAELVTRAAAAGSSRGKLVARGRRTTNREQRGEGERVAPHGSGRHSWCDG